MLIHPGAAQYPQSFTMTISSCSILFRCSFGSAHPLPVALPFDEDLVGVVGQPVKEGVGQERIIEEPHPFIQGP